MGVPNGLVSFEHPDNSQNTHGSSQERSWHSEEPDAEKFLLLDEGNRSIRNGSWRAPSPVRILASATVLNVILFLVSMVIFSSSNRASSVSAQDYWRATSYYSPVFDRFEIPKLTLVTNGTFWDTEPPSIWRVRTGAEADAAWEAIGSNIAPIIITAAEVRKLGKDPSVAVKAPPELNLGLDAYIAGMDVFHHLHCLDKLRREISYKHYHEAQEGPSPGSELHKAHIEHCIDVLAQTLRCTGSVDIVTFNWVEGHRMPQPDFNNNKVCRDFNALREWTVENGVDSERFFKTANRPPSGAIVVPGFHPHR